MLTPSFGLKPMSHTLLKNIESLSTQLGSQLASRGHFVTAAESCTGGGIAKAITEIAGSSQWFSYGFVTYGNNAKQQLLGVPEGLLAEYGAVSQPVVEAMVSGALREASADIAVAVSGVAGPGGGSPEKPVGTVWISWKKSENPPVSTCFLFEGDRKSIRNQTVEKSLQGLIEIL